MRNNVRFASTTDIGVGRKHVRYGPKADLRLKSIEANERRTIVGRWDVVSALADMWPNPQLSSRTGFLSGCLSTKRDALWIGCLTFTH